MTRTNGCADKLYLYFKPRDKKVHGKLRRAENKLRVRRNKEAAAARRQAAKEAKAAKKQKQKVRTHTHAPRPFIAHPSPLELWGFEFENRS